jgi:hypothetical protein
MTPKSHFLGANRKNRRAIQGKGDDRRAADRSDSNDADATRIDGLPE